MKSSGIDLGIVEIKWYSIMILIAIVVGTLLLFLEAKKKNLDKDTFIDMVFYGLLSAILGARIYYVLFNMGYYLQDLKEIFFIWHGGLAVHGGIIACFIFLYFYSKKKNLNLLLILDCIALSLIIGQAIGRWGNFFNGEAYGREVTLTFLQSLHLPKFIINGMYIDGIYREPTFLYESIACMIGFVILFFIRRKKGIKTGTLTSIYLIWYGLIRLIIESFRTDSLMLGPIKMAQLVSVICIIIGIIVLIKIKNHKEYIEDKIR